MLNFSVELDKDRPWRYAFAVSLWEGRKNKFGLPVNVLLDTGSFNTIIHERLIPKYGRMLKTKMMTRVGGYKGEAQLCVIDKISVNGHIIEKVVALAVPFEGELKDHILLGANVTNNWEFTLSRKKNSLKVAEEFSDEVLSREFPYRYCFDNKGRIMAFQEME